MCRCWDVFPPDASRPSGGLWEALKKPGDRLLRKSPDPCCGSQYIQSPPLSTRWPRHREIALEQQHGHPNTRGVAITHDRVNPFGDLLVQCRYLRRGHAPPDRRSPRPSRRHRPGRLRAGRPDVGLGRGRRNDPALGPSLAAAATRVDRARRPHLVHRFQPQRADAGQHSRDGTIKFWDMTRHMDRTVMEALSGGLGDSTSRSRQ